MYWIKSVIFHLIASVLAVFATDYFLDYININVEGTVQYIQYLAVFAILFGVLNAVVKPILKVVALPLMLMTLGLFSVVINGVILFGITILIPQVEVTWWEGYIIVPIVLEIVNWIAHHVIHAKKKKD